MSPSPDGTLAALRASASQYSGGDHADMAEKLGDCMGRLLYQPRTGNRAAAAADSTIPSQSCMSMPDTLPTASGSADTSKSSHLHIVCVTDDVGGPSLRRSGGPSTLLGVVKGSQVCLGGLQPLVTSPPPRGMCVVSAARCDRRDFNDHASPSVVADGTGDRP